MSTKQTTIPYIKSVIIEHNKDDAIWRWQNPG